MEGSLWKSFGESRAVDIKVKVNVKVKVEERFFEPDGRLTMEQ